MSEHRSVTEEPPWKDSRKTTESLKQALPVQNLTLNFDAAQNYKIYVLEASTWYFLPSLKFDFFFFSKFSPEKDNFNENIKPCFQKVK